MFNNDLLYIRNNMSGAPALSFANEVEMLKSLKTLFAGVEIDYTLIDGQKSSEIKEYHLIKRQSYF